LLKAVLRMIYPCKIFWHNTIVFVILGRKPKLHNWASYFERTKSHGAPLRLFKEVCYCSDFVVIKHIITVAMKFIRRNCFNVKYTVNQILFTAILFRNSSVINWLMASDYHEEAFFITRGIFSHVN
jgi:hypothetical protein